VVLYPLIWMFGTSFKAQDEILSNVSVWPESWTPGNYPDGWTHFKSASVTFGRFFLNSTLVALLVVLGNAASCLLAAYAFARLRFPGRNALFLIVLATTMVPSEITLIPNFVTIRRFPLAGGNDLFGSGGSGLYDTYPAMILPFLAGAFNIFLLRQAFMRVPNEYWEAAQLDGSSGLGFLWRIMLPLTVPALFTVALFGFLGRWNALLWPLIVTRSESMRPVQVAMIYYQNEFQTNYGMVMAASFMVTLPIIVVFVLAQKSFIAGISSAGLKG
jgi:multiple sugar transport system permease protein